MKKLMVSVLSVLTAFALNADCCDVNYHFRVPSPETEPKSAKVTIDDSFWAPRLRLWEGVTAYDVLKKQEPWMLNFDRVARGEKGTGEGPDFCDGHVYEAICGIADHLRFSHDERMKRKLDGLIARIAAAQAPDGYLQTKTMLNYPKCRFGANGGNALHQHELYNSGMLVEAGVRHYRATGETTLLQVAVRNANFIADTIGPDGKLNKVPTHEGPEEPYLSLARLCEAEPALAAKTGARPSAYRSLVRFWISSRGHVGFEDWFKTNPRPSWGTYAQDHCPLEEQTTIEGHAVRAALFLTGVAAAVADGKSEWLAPARRLWENMVGRKMYVTGGIGALSDYERFGPDYFLPSDAYLETCAAVGNAFYSSQMARLENDARYADVVETVLYNALLTAVGTNGCTYTYVNPLNSKKLERWAWHECPCCPPMFLKVTGRLDELISHSTAEALFVDLFIGSRSEELEIKTDYPASGIVRIRPRREGDYMLKVRVPGWARGVENPFGLYTASPLAAPMLAVNGEAVPLTLDRGYAVIRRTWKKGDEVCLTLDLSRRTITAHSSVQDLVGRCAFAEGPILWARERPLTGGVWRELPYHAVANGGPVEIETWRPMLPEAKNDFGDAKWIGGSVPTDAPPAFRRVFSVEGGVRRAEMAICGLGYSLAELNGRRVGERELDPVPSDYSRRVYYSTYDVTDLIRPGTNVLSVLLGRGWYDFHERDEWNFDKAPWRGEPKLRLRLTVEGLDGQCAEIVTDGSWRQVGNPVRYDSVRSGIEEDGPAPELDAPVKIVEGPSGQLLPAPCAPTKVVRRLRPVRTRDLGDGRWLFDFGEALAGRVRLTLRGQRTGDVVTVRYDERVGEDFTPATNRVIDAYYKGVGRNFQTDIHHASGADVETFAPRFTYKGFRYALVTGVRRPPDADGVVAEVLQTAFETTGSFSCSSSALNGLMALADRSYRANWANGVPTDCPHREKNGWAGDVNLAATFGLYAYGNSAGYVKWLRDFADSQREDGTLPGIAPTAGWGYDGHGSVWEGAILDIPYELWRFTGSEDALREFFPAMVRNFDLRLRARVAGTGKGLVDEGCGDWCSIRKPQTDNTFVSSAWMYGNLVRLAFVAGLVGDAEARRRYEDRARQLRADFNAAYYRGDGTYSVDDETACALVLEMGLVPETDRTVAERRLVRSVEAAGCHLTGGVLCLKTILRALSKAGRSDLAYGLLVNETEPSPFASWLKRGATTLWEDFDDGFSRCHVMFADYAAWAYEYLAGIRDPQNGFRTFTLAPEPIPQLDHVTASLKTPKGIVRSHWERKDGRVFFRFVIPAGAKANVRFGETHAEYGEGSYELSRLDGGKGSR